MQAITELKQGRQLDAAVAQIRNDPPDFFIMAATEDESAYCASVTHNGPWCTEYELREWLKDQQARGQCLEYHIAKKPKYKRYSADLNLAQRLLEEIIEKYGNAIGDRHRRYWHIVNVAMFPNGKEVMGWSIHLREENATKSWPIMETRTEGLSMAVAICRAYLLAHAAFE